jgi:O-antigen ligase
MRIALLKIIFPVLSIISILNPFYGILNYTFISIVRPEQLTHGTPAVGGVFALAIVCLLISCILHKEKIFKIFYDKFFLCFVLFIGFLAISTYVSPYTDFNEDKGSIYYLNQYPQIYIFCLCLYAVLKRSTQKDFTLYIIILVSLFSFMGMWAIEQYFRGNVLIENLFGTAIIDRCAITAVYVLYFPLSLFLYNRNKGLEKLAYLGCAIIFVIVIILTQSRAGFLGFSISILVLWLNSKKKLRYFAIVLTMAMFSLIFVPDGYIDRIKSIQWQSTSEAEVTDPSSASRIILWKIALNIFSDNPIIGVGNLNFSKAGAGYYGDFSGKTNEYLLDYIFDSTKLRLTHCHNTFLNILAEGGLLSSLPFFIMFFLPIKRWVVNTVIGSCYDTDAIDCAGYINSGLIGFLVTAIFGNLLILDYFYWNITLSYFLSNKFSYDKNEKS